MHYQVHFEDLARIQHGIEAVCTYCIHFNLEMVTINKIIRDCSNI